jgi:hypothetical protein
MRQKWHPLGCSERVPDTTSHLKTKGDAMSNSSTLKKPEKPYPGFPMFPHATKRWAKKIRGKLHYFGRWDDPGAALQKYLDQKDDLYAGRTPRVSGEGLTIAELCNHFLNTKRHLLDNGEITDGTFRDYYETCYRIVDTFSRNRLVDDLFADDFGLLRISLAKTRGPAALKNQIGNVRMVFKFGYDQLLIDKPIRYGQSFNKSSRKVLRIARNKNGPRMFEADELRKILETAKRPVKAMVLLGINCGFGQSDIANLPQSAIDFDNGWIEFPRPKTGIERRCQLWPETVEALREATEAEG